MQIRLVCQEPNLLGAGLYEKEGSIGIRVGRPHSCSDASHARF